MTQRTYKGKVAPSWAEYVVVGPDAWYDLSENWRKPSRECLEQVFKEWAKLAGIPVKTKLEKL